MDQTVEENFGIHIDHNVGISFDGFQMVVDKLDGIDITLTQDEADYMELWGFAMEEGVNHMNGEEALAYARSRYVGTGKGGQRLWTHLPPARVVVTQVFKKLMSRPITQIMDILNSVMECGDGYHQQCGTSWPMPMRSIIGIDDLQAYRLPQDGGIRMRPSIRWRF